MSHYEHCSWRAWKRHMLYVFLAHLFVTTLRRKLGEKKGLTFSLAQQYTAGAIRLVTYRLRRNEVAARSHR